MPDILRKWLVAFVLCAAAVIVCVLWVDRIVADAVSWFMWTGPWFWIRRLLAAATGVAALLVVWSIGCGVLVVFGRRLKTWVELPLQCGLSVALSIAVETILKRVFGRYSPNPEYVLNHVYGFRFLHGVVGQDAFPSGTAMVAAALTTVIRMKAPRFQMAAICVSTLMCIGLVITNTHWLGDVIAGSFIGALVGVITVQLQKVEFEPPPDKHLPNG